MAQDINIKVNVDTTSAQAQTTDYGKRLKKLTDEMVKLNVETEGLSKATAEQKKRFNELAKEAGNIKDAMGDAQAQVNNLSDDYAKLNTAIQAIQGAVGAITAVTGAMNLMGVESEEANEAIKDMTSLIAILQGLQSVEKTFNKDSLVMKALQTAKNKLLTQSIKEQTKAQVALNVAKKGMLGVIALAVPALGVLIAKYASAKNKVAEFSKEMNKSAVDAVAPMVVKINDLSGKYKKLGDDIKAKEQFIKDNQKAFSELGVSVKSVEEAENLLISNTDKFTNALMARAKAQYAQEKINEIVKQQLEDQLEYERRFIDGNKTFVEEVSDGYNKMKYGAVEYSLVMKIAQKQEEEAQNAEIKKLQELKDALNAEANQLLETAGVTEESTQSDEKKVDALQAMNQALERTNLLLKLKHTDAINSAKTASEKLIATKKLQYESLTAEIDALEKVNEKLDKNSTQYLKNELRIKELKQQRQELFKVEEITAEEEEALEAERMESAKKYLDAQIVAIKEHNAQKKAEEEEWQAFLDAEAERERERLEKLEAEKEKIREQKWQSAQDIVSAYNELVTTAMEAELEAVGDNEEEQKAIRKKYAKSQFIGQIASIGIATAQSIMGAWASASTLPYPVNLIVGGIMSALLAGTGIAQSIKAKNEMNTALRAEKGGILVGASHAQGGIMLSNGVEAEGGEAIINKRSTEAFAPLLSEINSYNGYGAPLISAQPTSSSSSSSLSSDSAIRKIVQETIAGVTAIPVVVSEHSITEAQRQVGITRERAFI